MADDQLKNLVLQRADDDESLSEDARLVVLAALESDGDLAEVLSDGAAPPAMVAALTAPAQEDVVPIGAFLRSISVQGFRGIGPKVTVPLIPGPGLTVIAGRNGSGKSTLAEALELALTGINSRWQGKAAVWSQNWRNLHEPNIAEIRVGIAESGEGGTTIGVDWPMGDVPVGDHKAWVQRPRAKQETRAVLGWSAALELYRPLLSYDELGSILEGRPSEFYDELHKLLGLEQLTEAIIRLDDEVKRLKQPVTELKASKDLLKSMLPQIDDPRSAVALKEIGKHTPQPDAVRPLVVGTDESISAGWRTAAQLAAPERDAILALTDELRAAAAAEAAEAEQSDTAAADRAGLIERALAFHAKHGDASCPVCGSGQLDDSWATDARAALTADR